MGPFLEKTLEGKQNFVSEFCGCFLGQNVFFPFGHKMTFG